MSESEIEAVKDEIRTGFSEGLFDRLFQSLGGNAQSSLVFGEAVHRGDTTVIPVARIAYGFGLGGGQGKGLRERETRAEGGGSGGGGGVIGEPVGYIEIREGKGTRFVPTPARRMRDAGICLCALALPLLCCVLLKREKKQ